VIATPRTLPGRHFLVLVVAFVASFPYGWRASASVALGGGIQAVNLKALERGVAWLLGLASVGGPLSGAARLGAGILVQLRWAVLLATVAVVLLTLPVEPIALLVGLSTAVLAVVWHGFATAGPSRTGQR
jgi:hypothetical protein